MTKEEVLEKMFERLKDYEKAVLIAGGEPIVNFVLIEDGVATYVSGLPVKEGEIGQRYKIVFYPVHCNYDENACYVMAYDIWKRAVGAMFKRCGVWTALITCFKMRKIQKRVIRMAKRDAKNKKKEV